MNGYRLDLVVKFLEVHKDLLDKRDVLRQKKLLDAIAQSGRSYEEIMQYLQDKPEEV